jgi:hypothetical protein
MRWVVSLEYLPIKSGLPLQHLLLMPFWWHIVLLFKVLCHFY